MRFLFCLFSSGFEKKNLGNKHLGGSVRKKGGETYQVLRCHRSGDVIVESVSLQNWMKIFMSIERQIVKERPGIGSRVG